jgi:hypothetical protein
MYIGIISQVKEEIEEIQPRGYILYTITYITKVMWISWHFEHGGKV